MFTIRYNVSLTLSYIMRNMPEWIRMYVYVMNKTTRVRDIVCVVRMIAFHELDPKCSVTKA